MKTLLETHSPKVQDRSSQTFAQYQNFASAKIKFKKGGHARFELEHT